MQLTARSALLAVALCACAFATVADEIRLKDGKKLYGVIVAYEDNMFKIKTDYGFVLVEKDKIASINHKPLPPRALRDLEQVASLPILAQRSQNSRTSLSVPRGQRHQTQVKSRLQRSNQRCPL